MLPPGNSLPTVVKTALLLFAVIHVSVAAGKWYALGSSVKETVSPLCLIAQAWWDITFVQTTFSTG